MKKLFYTKILNRHVFSAAIIFLISISYFPASALSPTQNHASADTSDYKWETFSITAGGFFSGLNNEIIVGSEQLGLGVFVNIEDALGLETSSFVFRSDMNYYFGKQNRHGINLGYFGFLRNATKVLESELTIGDNVYPIGTTINSKFNYQIIKLEYDYSYFIDQRIRLGASFGFFVMPINFSARAFSSDATKAKFIAPLPVIGLNAAYAISPKLSIKQSIHLFYLKVAGYTGSINDINVCVEYNPWNHFGFGLGYNYYHLGISSESDDSTFLKFEGEVNSEHTGLMMYARYFF